MLTGKSVQMGTQREVGLGKVKGYREEQLERKKQGPELLRVKRT